MILHLYVEEIEIIPEEYKSSVKKIGVRRGVNIEGSTEGEEEQVENEKG
jgi:hypothetical protein